MMDAGAGTPANRALAQEAAIQTFPTVHFYMHGTRVGQVCLSMVRHSIASGQDIAIAEGLSYLTP